MLTVEEAQRAILAAVGILPAARVSLLDSLGLVLAEDVHSDIDSPPFDNSAVDGFAVIAAETAGASESRPVLLCELPGVAAGGVPAAPLMPGTCMRVMTGAPMPAGADAMVMREDTRETAGGVTILAAAGPGDHVRNRGENVAAGARAIEAGARIGAAEIGLLATAGAVNPLCVRLPRVAVFSTGDELVDAGAMPGPGQIRDSNRVTLAALVLEAGAELHSINHVGDDLDATIQALRDCAGLALTPRPPLPKTGEGELNRHARHSPGWVEGRTTTPTESIPSSEETGAGALPLSPLPGYASREGVVGDALPLSPLLAKEGVGGGVADVIVTSGGVSVGDRDFVKPALESIGRLDLWRVNMKPGKPVAFGRIPRPDGGETLFFGLPGNPVSTMVTFELFVRPALWKLAGRRDLARPRITVRLAEGVAHRPGRQEFVRATAAWRDGEWHAWPTGSQNSHLLGSMLGANALIILPAETGDMEAGARADALLLAAQITDQGET